MFCFFHSGASHLASLLSRMFSSSCNKQVYVGPLNTFNATMYQTGFNPIGVCGRPTAPFPTGVSDVEPAHPVRVEAERATCEGSGLTNFVFLRCVVRMALDGIRMPDGCYADGTWELKMHVTDLHKDVSLRVTGEIHIGGVMLKLVEELGKNKLPITCMNTPFGGRLISCGDCRH